MQIKHPVTGLVADVPAESMVHWRGAGWLTVEEHADREQQLAEARAAEEAAAKKAAGAAKGGAKSDSGSKE